jgi:hypothetical protein
MRCERNYERGVDINLEGNVLAYSKATLIWGDKWEPGQDAEGIAGNSDEIRK